jgi:hypothetical protein
MVDDPELQALRNLIVRAHAIVSTTDLPNDRDRRMREVLSSAIALVDDLLTREPAVIRVGMPQAPPRGDQAFEQLLPVTTSRDVTNCMHLSLACRAEWQYHIDSAARACRLIEPVYPASGS